MARDVLKEQIELEENSNKIESLCLKRDKNKLIELSIENIWKVNSMLKENSRYTLDMNYDRIPPDSDFINKYLEKFINNSIADSKNMYCGSTAWWVKQLKDLHNNDEKQYKLIIAGLIHDIDRMNTTHLNADKNGNKNGRFLVYSSIIEDYKNKDELIKALKNDKEKPILYSISKKDTNGKFNFSFATKFCHYISWNFFEEPKYKDMYSIYDGIVSKNLSRYLKEYQNNEKVVSFIEELKESLEKIDIKLVNKYFYGNSYKLKETFYNKFFIKPFFKEKSKEENKYEDASIIIFYNIYRNAIDCIREVYAEKTEIISRNAFDHLLWYGNKGIEIRRKNEVTLTELLNK